jgi:hypothetical protein
MAWEKWWRDEDTPNGESSLPQLRSIGQDRFRRLVSSRVSSVFRSVFLWVASLVWYLLVLRWNASCTVGIPRSECSVAIVTYHGASTIIRRILDWLRWIIALLEGLAQPHNSRPYVQIGVIMVL